MYALIWRALPGGRLGKAVSALALAVAVAAFLWFVAFPWLEPHIPLDQAEVDPGGAAPGR
ncbi:MAG: hypothetical protein GEV11_06430 [Streptosporangiales bacterium]|nr:hypothetical protein [Streptosporangiales bacterium]